MGIFRVFAGSDGESHIEELRLEEHPELGALTNLSEVRIQQFNGTRNMDFHPLPEQMMNNFRQDIRLVVSMNDSGNGISMISHFQTRFRTGNSHYLRFDAGKIRVKDMTLKRNILKSLVPNKSNKLTPVPTHARIGTS